MFLKVMPKKGAYITFVVTPSETQVSQQEVHFINVDNTVLTFTAPLMPYPDYTMFLSRAMRNKEKETTLQGRVFPSKLFTLIAKALPSEHFTFYWDTDGERDGPCLIEHEENRRFQQKSGVTDAGTQRRTHEHFH